MQNSDLLFTGQRCSTQGPGVHPCAGRDRERQHLNLPRDLLLPATDHHRSAEEWRENSESQSDGAGFRGQLELPPDQICGHQTHRRRQVRLQSGTLGENQRSLFGTWHVSSVVHHVPGLLSLEEVKKIYV